MLNEIQYRLETRLTNVPKLPSTSIFLENLHFRYFVLLFAEKKNYKIYLSYLR